MDIPLGKGDFNPFLDKPLVDSGIELVQNPAPKNRFDDPAQQLMVKVRAVGHPHLNPDAKFFMITPGFIGNLGISHDGIGHGNLHIASC